MKTVSRTFSFDYEEKKSHFLAYLTSYENFNSLLKTLQEEHPKARHFVTASRHFNENDQIVESFSDDGEPRGTSGKPTLKVLQGNDLVNVAVITVRYFGGIKLGTGGLVRAYSDALNSAIEESELELYEKLECREFEVPFKDISKFEYDVEKLLIKVIKKDFNENGGFFTVEGTKERLDELAEKI